jgi:hypothetical protein
LSLNSRNQREYTGAGKLAPAPCRVSGPFFSSGVAAAEAARSAGAGASFFEQPRAAKAHTRLKKTNRLERRRLGIIDFWAFLLRRGGVWDRCLRDSARQVTRTTPAPPNRCAAFIEPAAPTGAQRRLGDRQHRHSMATLMARLCDDRVMTLRTSCDGFRDLRPSKSCAPEGWTGLRSAASSGATWTRTPRRTRTVSRTPGYC